MKSFLWFLFMLKVFLYFCRLIYCQKDLEQINSTSEYFFNLKICAFNVFNLFPDCGAMVITKETQFKQLELCVTIAGSLTFESFTYSNFSFPFLLFIKDSLTIHNINNLLSVRQLLPNLIHIEGSDWKLEFALSVTDNKDLEKLDFKRLMRISSGYVEIKDNPRLCLTDFISWVKIQDSISSTEGRKRIKV